MKIALLYNLKKKVKNHEVHDRYAEFDKIETINAIKTAIESRKNLHIHLIEADERAYFKIKKLRPDFIFNIAEGLYGRSREAQMPLILEMNGIPYSGSGPLCLALCLDKVKTKEILMYHGIPTPKFQVFHDGKEKTDKRLKFPMICKLIHEGSSMGLSKDSIVKNKTELRRQIKCLLKKYKQDVLVEEFINGQEFTIGVIGNEKLEFFPILEIYLDKYPGKFDALTYEAKGIEHDDIYSGLPRNMNDKLRHEIYKLAEKTFKATYCRDFARIDIRLDEKGKPHVLELNPLPGLSPSLENVSFFPKAARLGGIGYNKLVNKMLDVALKRCNLLK